jgi:hypothetical protein
MMAKRNVIVRRGKHHGWSVVGHKAGGGPFMNTWWPTEAIARTVARWVGGG